LGLTSSGQGEPGERTATEAEPSPPDPVARSTETVPSHRWGLGAFLLVEAVLVLSAVFIGAIMEPVRGSAIPASSVIVGTIVPTTLAALVAVLVTVLRGNGPLIDLRLRWRADDVKTGLKLGVAGLVLTVVAAQIWSTVVGPQNAHSAVSALVDGPLPITAAIVMFLYTWLIGPICEEIIFRGLCWGAMERLQWGRWAAFLLSTAIFAMSHLEPLRTSLLLVIAIPIGLARLITGRLTASIVAHQVNNFLPALALLLVSLGVIAR
jgi:membrane protease YdiL (CAAX protease family)